MNLLELKSFVDRAIENAHEFEDDPAEIPVSIQIDRAVSESLWSKDIELIYDGDAQASGCVLHGWLADAETNKADSADTKKPCG